MRLSKMNKRNLLVTLSVILVSLFCTNNTVNAADWPQWRGPNRDGICTETGLLKSWPKDGPKLLWEIPGLGKGYSSLAISDGKLYTMGDIQVGSEEAQYIIAVDIATHKIIWTAKVGLKLEDGGPRCTPTVDNGFIYAIGTSGDLVCVNAEAGKEIWRKHLQKDLGGGENPQWQFSESPLIDGDMLLCTPGGHKAVIAALNKKTGDVIWQASMPDIGPNGKEEAGYSSIVISKGAGVKQYVQMTNEGVIGVSANGKFLWGYNRVANRVANIPIPVVDGDFVFASTAYQTGSALLKLTPDSGGVKAEEVYWLDKDKFQNHHGCYVLVDGYIYGGHGHNLSKPTCIEMKTGKVMWQEEQPGGGSAGVLYADGHLYFRYQDNVIALIEANPQKYNLKSTFTLPKRPTMSGEGWPHPVIVDGKLYVRHSDVLFVYDIKAQ